MSQSSGRFRPERVRVDPVTGVVEVRKLIKVKEIEANPNESFEMHQSMGMVTPRVAGKPVEVFDKDARHDTYQIIDGHRRVLLARKEGRDYIKAWVTIKPHPRGCMCPFHGGHKVASPLTQRSRMRSIRQARRGVI